MQRDQAAGRALELDALGGRAGIAVSATRRLVDELQSRNEANTLA
jgi:hypothetical protein